MRNRSPPASTGCRRIIRCSSPLVSIPLGPGVYGALHRRRASRQEIATGNDGVVEYKSAHIDGVASEFIVRIGHSCQGYPFAIEEVRRILYEHIGATGGRSAADGSAIAGFRTVGRSTAGIVPPWQ